MYKNKKDVDIHVEKLMSKLSLKDFKARAYSIARLYFEVGDYGSCQKYVEQYLTHKANNAAAHKLLGQTFQKMGFKDRAFEEFKISLDLDPAQTSIILDICAILVDDDTSIDAGRAKYWCEKAEATFPKHPITFKLREKLLTIANPDPEALTKLLTSELLARPKDAVLHFRLLKHYLDTNKMKEAFDHCCNVEFAKPPFLNNFAWYETMSEVLKRNSNKSNDWLFQLLLLTVKERLCTLSLTEIPQGQCKSLIESRELLNDYDQSIASVTKAGPTPGLAEFHTSLLQHHRAQFSFLAATFILKKAKKDQLNWHDATKLSSILMLVSWQSSPISPNVNWLTGASEKQRIAVLRWFLEGTYRCSQSGYFIFANHQDKTQLFLNQISQFCSGKNWKDKIYDNLFASGDKNKAESYLTSNFFNAPALRLPRKVEIQGYDIDAQKQYPNSLHHFVWILINYNDFADFKCTIFDMLKPTMTTCGPETLNKLDILAFLYSAAITAQKQKSKLNYIPADAPVIIPANITDLLCSLPQIKWWDCAYKFSQNELGTEYTDIRSTLTRGIEVVRCIDNHGLDPELLCTLGRIFDKLSQLASLEEKNVYESRAKLYYTSAIPLLEKLKSKSVIKLPAQRLFDYTHKEFDNKGLNILLQESKLFVALSHYNECEYVKAIEILSDLTTADSFYYLSESYKKLADEEKSTSRFNEINSKYATLLDKAKLYAYKALETIKEKESYKTLPLYSYIQGLIENTESSLGKIDKNLSVSLLNDGDRRYSSDENVSEIENVPLVSKSISQFSRNLSSTPKQSSKQLSNMNSTNYRTALDSQVFDNTHIDPHLLDRIEKQIKNLQKRDSTIDDFMEQTKNWFDENRKLGNQIINTIHSNIENTTEQFKLLKISVDQVKDQVSECRNECKDVADLKKQIAELKKEVNKLKKSSSEQTLNESDLYNLDEEYRANENASTFGNQMPFATPQVMPPFTQRLVPPFPVPPNPYHLYGQNLYNLYNQYSQLTQNSSVPGAPTMFDPNRAPVNYPGVYQTPDQMYLDVSQLIPPTIPPTPAVVQPVPNVPPISNVSSTIANSASIPSSKVIQQVSDVKTSSRTLPVNVVITSSDPLPTTSAPAPILSVTIPQKHIKGTPHNYQIPMPINTETSSAAPPVFNFPSNTKMTTPNITTSTSSNILSSWNKPGTLTTNQNTNFLGLNDSSKSAGDGIFTLSSPNTSLNKSRTLSERSNTSIENYDPCPDFKPIIPLPAEVKVTTGEENETAIFSARAKLFRFIDKQWKERGIGEMKLLKHNVTGKVRVLMRREQIHKICANHIIIPEMEIKPMKNETKAYFWVANDFAEETVILEKFCIRFKSVEIAQNFYDTFEKARIESSAIAGSVTKTNEVTKTTTTTTVTKTETKSETKESQPTKTVIGGFTFSTTPSFKTVTETAKEETKTVEPVTTKVSVFSGLTFKPANSSPFTNAFSSISNQKTDTPKDEEASHKLNTSDTIEEFEPTVDFKPVVPLPALVDQKTGEEDEIILFEHRAKLLRFDASNKEWKERGLGNIKLLVHKDNNQKLRLLMRREQIMKVCCNHAVTKEITFQKMPNMDKAVTWCAKDFSDGELIPETFCLRFKNVQICDDFMDAVKTAQSRLGDDMKAAKEEKNIAQQNNQSGFGDQFKLKPGSWECTACYTNNLESFTKCACCETPKPQDIKENVNSTWGDKFKAKPGTWECNQCLIRNQGDGVNCIACNSPKEPHLTKADSNLIKENVPKFNFGINPQVSTTKESVPNKPIASGWGDKFKPKEGSWECKQCFVRNEKDVETCPACNSSKDPGSSSTEVKSIFSNTSTPKYTFGIPQKSNEPNNVSTSSLFNANASQTFKFGISPNSDFSIKAFGDNSKNSVFSDVQANINSNKNEKDLPAQKPALLPTPSNAITFGSKEGGTFDFAFKPKSPVKGKSPLKSPKSIKGEESGDDEYVSEDEGAHIHFSPVIPMPDKVEVVTGEENEEELYGHRAKLFIFTASEWKERGIGIVKILKHKDSGKLRIVMRREQVHKICLNHVLSPDVIYKPKDEKTWLFAANDYSDGDLQLQQFCLRFQNKAIAQQFKQEVDQAIKNKYGDVVENKDVVIKEDEVIFVSEIQASSEEKQKAKELMLPENFYTYKNKSPCEGCRGCEDDDEKSEQAVKSQSQSDDYNKDEADATTPIKSSVVNLRSSSSSYGTPLASNKTMDNSIFQTPLGNTGPYNENNSPSTLQNALTGNKLNMFGGLFKNQPSTDLTSSESSVIKPVNFVSAGFVQTPTTGTKSSILAAPKFNALNTTGEQQNTAPKVSFGSAEPKSLFGSSEPKNLFGSATGNVPTSSQKSIFSNSGMSTNTSIFKATLNKSNEPNDSDVKSVFSVDEQKPINLFSGSSQGSLFGPTVLKTNETKPSGGIFGQSSTFSFGNLNPNAQDATKSATSEKSSIAHNLFNTQEKGTVGAKSLFAAANLDTKPINKSDNNGQPKEALKIPDVCLSFAELSSSTSEFAIQKKADFKWEGAGQQLFVSASGKEEGKSGNDTAEKSNTSATGEDEYDPHYEPIVPLPDKIVVTTGEEDEEKLFGERCKLYRFDEKTREWKERGIGEMKILYHPERKTYRLLLRREQVHKAVLNMLLFMDLELFPMKNSDRAWTWAGRNYADSAGEQETLAVRFKSVDLATKFQEKVLECVRKLQVAAAEAIRKEKEANENPVGGIAPLRLPKHLQDSARADKAMSSLSSAFGQSSTTSQNRDRSTENDNKQNGIFQSSDSSAGLKQVHFEEQQEQDEDEEDYEHDYDEHAGDSEDYYNEEEEEESAVYYACDGEVAIEEDGAQSTCKDAHVQVLFDNDVCSPKILVTDSNTGEILADMLIHTDTEFQIIGDTCSWSGIDYTRNTPADKKVTVYFPDSETTMEFYDSCETSKASTYVSNDPES
ncbi:E3 SUMO-protein ligase RanBP2-like [Colias croceus]|uniref:E3 SUMO-protein ligase RanBP2-like n=1 Tax=Colias crocea TaxID=72248 RepID=UPI001E27EBA1|nr:E3 SUMO-protein ligase RanBP2-like [Colias croceus]